MGYFVLAGSPPPTQKSPSYTYISVKKVPFASLGVFGDRTPTKRKRVHIFGACVGCARMGVSRAPTHQPKHLLCS